MTLPPPPGGGSFAFGDRLCYDVRMGNYKRQKPTAEEQAVINAKISANRKGKGTGSRSPEITTICPVCGKSFQQKKNLSTKKTYCSRQCANGIETLKVSPARQRYEADPKLCTCGLTIPFEYRNQRQYCSPECRMQYGAPTKVADPANHVTFNCETCGVEVTRYKKYGNGASRFCSNECSAHSYNAKVRVDDIVLDSGYEALVWGLAKLHKLPIERFDRSDCIHFGDGKTYGPDFIINGVPVEVKGYEDEDDRERYAAWEATGQSLVVLHKDDLLRLLGSQADFLSTLSTTA